MIQLLLFIFVFVLVFFIISAGIVTSLLSKLLRFIGNLLGMGNNRNDNHSHHTQTNNQPQQKKKIFSKDDGEYVDYEEE